MLTNHGGYALWLGQNNREHENYSHSQSTSDYPASSWDFDERLFQMPREVIFGARSPEAWLVIAKVALTGRSSWCNGRYVSNEPQKSCKERLQLRRSSLVLLKWVLTSPAHANDALEEFLLQQFVIRVFVLVLDVSFQNHALIASDFVLIYEKYSQECAYLSKIRTQHYLQGRCVLDQGCYCRTPAQRVFTCTHPCKLSLI